MPFPSVISRFSTLQVDESKEEEAIRNNLAVESSFGARLRNAFGSATTAISSSPALPYGTDSGASPRGSPSNAFTMRATSPSSVGSTTGNTIDHTDPELATKLLFHYIKSYQTHLNNKVLGLNPATLRYIGSRIREMKRAPPNARFSILDFFRKSDELSSYDFAHIENCFKSLKKIAIVGNNSITELDLRYFQNLCSLRVSKCEVVYISEPEEWSLYQEHRLHDIRIVKSKFPLSAMRAVPYKLQVMESPLEWDSISKLWISKIQVIECSRSKVGQLASLLVPEVARKVTNQDELQMDEDESDSLTEGAQPQLCIGWLELTSLSITQNNIRHIDQSLMYCPNLEYLDLRNNQIENLDTSIISKPLPKLHTIIIRNNFLESLSSSRNLIKFVRTLDVSHNHLSTLRGIEDAIHLENLDVSHNCLIDWRDVKRLRLLSTLHTLNLHHNTELEKNQDYRSSVVSYLQGKTKLHTLDGKSVTVWEKGKVALSSDSDTDVSRDERKNFTEYRREVSQITTSGIAVTSEKSATSTTYSGISGTPVMHETNLKLKKKKYRKRVRKVKDIPEYVPPTPSKDTIKDSNVDLNADSSQISSEVAEEVAEEPSTLLNQNTDMFFSHMSHFYEPAQQVDSAADSITREKDVEWTKQYLSSMLEDGGDQWLLILNEFMNPDRKKKKDVELNKKSLNEPSQADSVASGYAAQNIRNTEALNFAYQEKHRSRVPSLRNPLQQIRIVIDYTGLEDGESALILHVPDNGKRLRQNTDTPNFYSLNEEALQLETIEFLRELGYENEIVSLFKDETGFDEILPLSELHDDDPIDELLSLSSSEVQDPRAFASVLPSYDNSVSYESHFEENELSNRDEDSEVEQTDDFLESYYSNSDVETDIPDPITENAIDSVDSVDSVARFEKLHASPVQLKKEVVISEAANETMAESVSKADSKVVEPKVPEYKSELTMNDVESIACEKVVDDKEGVENTLFDGLTTLTAETNSKQTPSTPVDNSEERHNDTSSVDDVNGELSTAVMRIIEESSKQSKLLMSGYLYKEGGVWKNWKKRYFKLTEMYWTYGKDASGAIDVIETAKIQYVKAMLHKKAPKKFQKFGFVVSVEGDTNRVYKVCAESEKEMKNWMFALQSVIQSRDTMKSSMLLATNGDIFKLRHAKSDLYMDISSSGKLVFSQERLCNNIRWRHIAGRITNENLGTVLVADADGVCSFVSMDKNPGKESIWKSYNGGVMNENNQFITISNEWSTHESVEGHASPMKPKSMQQKFVVV